MEFIFTLKDFIWMITLIFSFAGGYFTLKFQSKNNKDNIEDFKSFKEFVYKELKGIDRKCDQMMEEQLARATFVTLDVYQSEMKHLNETVKEIKEQNTKIIDLITRSLGGN